MDRLPDIINTSIISNTANDFWADTEGRLQGLEPRSVLVVSTPFTPGSEEDALIRKMLQGCTLQEMDYHILQLDPEDRLAWHVMRDQLEPRQVILLGILPEQLGISVQFMPHQLTRFNDRSWVPTSSPDQLIQYPDIKGHLWKYGLKPLFIDKVYG
jgi:hypothetical protein